MLKYRLLFASILVAAFLNSSQAQDGDGMPAELEVTLDRTAQRGIGYHISGTIPLVLPDGDDTFALQAKMRVYWRISPAYGKCKSGAAFIPIRVLGRRNRERLTLTIPLPPEVRRPACNDGILIDANSKVLVYRGNPTLAEFTLSVADGSNEERTFEDSSHLDKLMGKLALHLACPVRLIDSESAPAISVSPTDTIPWPLVFDHSKTSAELSALAKTPSGVAGLTRPGKPYPPVATFRAVGQHAALRPGFCFWIKSTQVEFTPVEILLSSKYPAGSCEYKAVWEHEMLHYQDLQVLFIRYLALVEAALRQADLPTIERPVFVESVSEGSSRSKARIQSTLQPIYASMEKAIVADTDARDTPEERVRSWNQCPNWYASFAGME